MTLFPEWHFQVRLEWPTDLAINPMDNSIYVLDNNIVLQITENRQVGAIVHVSHGYSPGRLRRCSVYNKSTFILFMGISSPLLQVCVAMDNYQSICYTMIIIKIIIIIVIIIHIIYVALFEH